MSDTRDDDTGKKAPFRCLSESEILLLEQAYCTHADVSPQGSSVAEAALMKLRRWSDEAVRWGEKQEIEIRILRSPDSTEVVTMRVRAHVYGEWAAHARVTWSRLLSERGIDIRVWSVTHIHTGMAIPYIHPTPVQATAIAATLAGRVPSLATAAEVKKSTHLIIPAVRLIIPDAYLGARF
jgi:hypothetical protein